MRITSPSDRILTSTLLAAFAVCHAAIGLAANIVLLALSLALVDGPKYAMTAASNHDLILLAAEVEAIGENSITAVSNHKVLFREVGDSALETQTTVSTTATTTQTVVTNTATATQTVVTQTAGGQIPGDMFYAF